MRYVVDKTLTIVFSETSKERGQDITSYIADDIKLENTLIYDCDSAQIILRHIVNTSDKCVDRETTTQWQNKIMTLISSAATKLKARITYVLVDDSQYGVILLDTRDSD